MNQATLTHLFQEELYKIPPRVLVILAREWETYSQDDKTLLTKILASVRLSPNAVQLAVQNTLSLPAIALYNPAKVLVFGSSGADIKPYEASQIHGFWLIKADDLNQLDDTKKKNLWLALKTMFGL